MTTQDERLDAVDQDSVLAILCFDAKNAQTVRYAITPQLFETANHKEIAGAAIDFVDRYKEHIGDHLEQELDHLLNGEDKPRAASMRRLIDRIEDVYRTAQPEYVINRLHKFVKKQRQTSALKDALLAHQAGDETALDEAIVKLNAAPVGAFNAGISLANPDEALTFFDKLEEAFETDIKALDIFGVGPVRGAVMLLAGPLGKGKSWWLMQLGRAAMRQNKVVVHITLEMSAELVSQRYMQMLFSVTKDGKPVSKAVLNRSPDGSFYPTMEEVTDRPSFQDEGIRDRLANKIKRGQVGRARFYVKKFPAGSLTMAGLNSYLDGLARYHGIVPDLLLIDYAELMALDPKNKRDSIGSLFVDLRGLADERQLALVTASQINRGGIQKAGVTNESDLAEDIQKAMHADILVTYNQTPQEYALGVARLFVAKNRNEAGGMTAMITQAYAMGQFCLDSVIMPTRVTHQGVDDDEDEYDHKGRREREHERESRAPAAKRGRPARKSTTPRPR